MPLLLRRARLLRRQLTLLHLPALRLRQHSPALLLLLQLTRLRHLLLARRRQRNRALHPLQSIPLHRRRMRPRQHSLALLLLLLPIWLRHLCPARPRQRCPARLLLLQHIRPHHLRPTRPRQRSRALHLLPYTQWRLPAGHRQRLHLQLLHFLPTQVSSKGVVLSLPPLLHRTPAPPLAPASVVLLTTTPA